jgi:hypothetical protein
VVRDLVDAVRLLLRPEWTRDPGQESVRPGKVIADNGDPIVVFVVGLRINRWRAVRYWVPLVLTMPSMLLGLTRVPEGGLLGYRLLLGPGPRQAAILQYWRRPEDLHEFASDLAGLHRSAKRRYWWHYASTEAVGVWHELFVSAEGQHQGMYGNMPPIGLGALRLVRPGQWSAQGPGEAGGAMREAGSRRAPR